MRKPIADLGNSPSASIPMYSLHHFAINTRWYRQASHLNPPQVWIFEAPKANIPLLALRHGLQLRDICIPFRSSCYADVRGYRDGIRTMNSSLLNINLFMRIELVVCLKKLLVGLWNIVVATVSDRMFDAKILTSLLGFFLCKVREGVIR